MSQMGRLYDQDVWDDEPQQKAGKSPWLLTVPPTGIDVDDHLLLVREQAKLETEAKRKYDSMGAAWTARLELEKF